MTDVVYVGTYTHPGKSRGIYVLRRDGGVLTPLHVVEDVADPAFLALGPGHRHLYCVNWLKPAGQMSAFGVEPDGDLRFVNRVPAGGADPCHLCVAPTGRFVLNACHESGTAAVLPIRADGGLEPPSDVVQQVGSGPRPAQTHARAHFVDFDPNGRFVLVCDKGADKVFVYRLDANAGKLIPNDPPFAQLHPGAGPRHFAFHPSGRFVYVNNEQDSTLSAFAYDAERGALEHLQTGPTVPAGYDRPNTSSEIQMAPSGRFVYVSNRGHDSIAIFALDGATGCFEPAGHEPSSGETPRYFALDPSGAWLFACNQNSDTIVTFAVDPASGQLRATGDLAEVPNPSCLIFHSV